MNFTMRVGAFVIIAIAGFFVWQWLEEPTDLSALAVRQFRDADTGAIERASTAQIWWPLVWPALAIVIGVVLFWDDAEKWWTNQAV